MNHERLQALLDAFGANPDRWPDEEREAALHLLETDPALRESAERQAQLDLALGSWEPEVPALNLQALNARLAQTSRQDMLDRILAWLIPEETLTLWRPAFAAACTLALGIALGSTLNLNADAEDEFAQSWDDELYLLALETPADEDIPL